MIGRHRQVRIACFENEMCRYGSGFESRAGNVILRVKRTYRQRPLAQNKEETYAGL